MELFQSWTLKGKQWPWHCPSLAGLLGCTRHRKLQVRSVMLTRVNGRTADNVPKDPLNCRSQTCSLQAHSIASSQGLAQVSANHSKGQRSALTYGPLGKRRHKGFTWQKHHSQKQSRDTSTQQYNKASQNIAPFLIAIPLLFQLVKCVSLSTPHSLSAAPHLELVEMKELQRSWPLRAHIIQNIHAEHAQQHQNKFPLIFMLDEFSS